MQPDEIMPILRTPHALPAPRAHVPMHRHARAACALGLLASLLALSGCGVGQAVADGTVNAAKWAFTTQVKTMNVDLVARAALNGDAAGQPLSVVVRLYQLKDANTFGQLEYRQLQTDDLNALKADLLATRDIVLRPGASASVSEPMDANAQYVGVVAFFRDPDGQSVWKLTIPKKQWTKTDPVRIEAHDNVLELVGAKQKPVRHQAPQQSAPPGPASSAQAASAPAPASAAHAK